MLVYSTILSPSTILVKVQFFLIKFSINPVDKETYMFVTETMQWKFSFLVKLLKTQNKTQKHFLTIVECIYLSSVIFHLFFKFFKHIFRIAFVVLFNGLLNIIKINFSFCTKHILYYMGPLYTLPKSWRKSFHCSKWTLLRSRFYFSPRRWPIPTIEFDTNKSEAKKQNNYFCAKLWN